MSRNAFLYMVIFLEGYVVLSAELLAIRQLIPYVGNGIETVSVIIAAVLVPLAFGYYHGGNLKFGVGHSPRRILTKNFVTAQIFFAVGLSYAMLNIIFDVIEMLPGGRIFYTILYSAIFLVYPTYLLGQTVPLLSHYLGRGSDSLSEATGKVLFFSTLGSFTGALASTLIWMTFFGVHVTVMANSVLLTVMTIVLSKPRIRDFFKRNAPIASSSFVSLFIFLSVVALNSLDSTSENGILAMTPYSTVKVHPVSDKPDHRVFNVNHSASSVYGGKDGDKFAYHAYLDTLFFKPLADRKDCPCDILVIGAGGFSVGVDDDVNHYSYVDIDAKLKPLAEEFFLKEKLGDNKTFYPEPARAFLRNTEKTYDIILLDAFTNRISVPPQLLTIEFFQQVKSKLNENGAVLFNFIASHDFEDDFAVKVDNTFRAVFPLYGRQVAIEGETARKDGIYNIVYTYRHRGYERTKDVYTDNKNPYYIDKTF